MFDLHEALYYAKNFSQDLFTLPCFKVAENFTTYFEVPVQ